MVLESKEWSFPLDLPLERDAVADYLGQQQTAKSGRHGRLALPATSRSDTTFFCCLLSLRCENRAQAAALSTREIIDKVAAPFRFWSRIGCKASSMWPLLSCRRGKRLRGNGVVPARGYLRLSMPMQSERSAAGWLLTGTVGRRRPADRILDQAPIGL